VRNVLPDREFRRGRALDAKLFRVRLNAGTKRPQLDVFATRRSRSNMWKVLEGGSLSARDLGLSVCWELRRLRICFVGCGPLRDRFVDDMNVQLFDECLARG